MRVPQVSERIKEAPAQALRGVFSGIGQLLLITDRIRHKTPGDQDVPRARTPEKVETDTDAPVTSPAGAAEETVVSETVVIVTEPTGTEPTAEAAVVAETAVVAEPASAAEAALVETALAAAAPVEAEAGPAEAGPAEADPAEAAPAKAAARRSSAKPTSVKAAPAKPAAKPATRRTAAKPAADPEAEAAPRPPKRQSTRNFDKTGNVRVVAAATPESVEAAVTPEPVVASEPVVTEEPVVAAEAVETSVAPLPNYDTLTVASIRARLRNLGIEQVRQLAEYERTHAAREDVLGMYQRRIAKLEAEAQAAGAPEPQA